MPQTPDRSLRHRLASELDALREQAQFRTLDSPSGVNLSSNDYLGLASEPRLRQAVLEGIARSESVGGTGSRLLSGNCKEWEELEADFAAFAGTESSLYFGSGYAANVGLLASLLQPGDIVFSDALNHASIIDGVRLSRVRKVIYPHVDLASLEESLRAHRDHRGAKIIVSETIFSMEGDVAPVARLLELAKAYGAELVLDEAHAIGVRGPHGRGIAAEHAIERDVLAIVHTCGKALAGAGAFVCCAAELRHYLINRARTFIFSTAMPPYLAHQIRAALGLARDAHGRRNHLAKISSVLRAELALANYPPCPSSSQIVPVVLGSNEAALRAAAKLQSAGFAVRAIRPPTVPEGAARLRLSLTSKITWDEVHRLVAALGDAPRPFSERPAGLVHVM